MRARRKDQEAVDRILVAVDGSRSSDKAVQLAAGMAKSLGAELTVLHVVPIEEMPTIIAETEDREREEKGQMILADAMKLAGLEGVSAKFVLRKGHPADQILRYASSYNPQLIVTGSRGMTGAKGVLMGSVSMAVSRRARCSVVIAR